MSRLSARLQSEVIKHEGRSPTGGFQQRTSAQTRHGLRAQKAAKGEARSGNASVSGTPTGHKKADRDLEYKVGDPKAGNLQTVDETAFLDSPHDDSPLRFAAGIGADQHSFASASVQ